MSNTKIIFFGSPDFSVPSLKKLYGAGFDIVAVVTSPDKPVGRKQILTPSPIKTEALNLGVSVFSPTTLKDGVFFKEFKEFFPDLCVVVSYGKIIPQDFLNVPRYGFLNIHPSLLPKYRGPTPIQSAILNGDDETGISIMSLDKDMDHGPVLCQIKYQNLNLKSFEQASSDLSLLGADLLVQTIPKWINNDIMPKEQDHELATFTKKYTRDDGKINWAEPAILILNKVRALGTDPGTWTVWNDKIINILKCEIIPDSKNEKAGSISKIDKNIVVKTETDYIALELIKPEGKKEMSGQAFANGNKNFVGSVLK